MKFQKRKLGNEGLVVSSLGLGCMGMSQSYGVPDDAESIATIHRALEIGINFFDTAELYGPFTNEQLLGKALKGKREQAIIATKFGFHIEGGKIAGMDSRPEHIKNVVEASLKRLGTDYIDLLYQHRVDPKIPIEDVVATMSGLVKEGKVRFLGLSEASPNTLRKAHRVHPITALQSEYSLWERHVETDILPTVRQLGIGFVPFSPLGRGFLTGKAPKAEEYQVKDYRQVDPRFQGSNYDSNIQATQVVRTIALEKQATPAQIALAWLLQQGDDIVPIPGTKQQKYLLENAASLALKLSSDDLKRIDEAMPQGKTAGKRYPDQHLAYIDRS